MQGDFGMSTPAHLEEYHVLFEHYKLMIEDIARMNDRRLVNSDVYIGLNTFLLTGMVFLLSISHSVSWLLPSVFLVVTLLALVINQTWKSSLESYRQMINLRVTYIQKFEQRLQYLYQHIAPTEGDRLDVGVFMREAQFTQQPGFTRVELRLTWLFMALYPAVTIGVFLLTYLVNNHLLTPISL